MQYISPNITERQVVRLWQEVSRQVALVTDEGELITVVYPGRTNDEHGADFRDAVIIKGGVLKKGDIEVHVRSSFWWEHKHHLDAAYNRVVLHVALWRNEDAPNHLQNGERVPLVVLGKHLNGMEEAVRSSSFQPDNSGLYLPCQEAVKHLSPGIVADVLDGVGERRFRDRAGELQAEIAVAGAEQCLYQNMMAALGYSRNKRSFLELARRLPLRSLESANQDAGGDDEYLVRQQALLLGTAGLLPSQRPGFRASLSDEEWVKRLDSVGVSLRPDAVMSPGDWCLFKVRPHNHPVRRIVALSYLSLRFRREGMFNGMVNLVKRTADAGKVGEVEQGLMVTCGGYWLFHSDFGQRMGRRCSSLLGGGRAAEMVVNVLLPFVFTWGGATSQRALAGQALELFRHYSVLPGNTVTRHMMAQLRLDGRLVNSARRQQGLIYLYKNYCIQGACGTCILRQALP